MSCGSLTEQMNIYQMLILYLFHKKTQKQTVTGVVHRTDFLDYSTRENLDSIVLIYAD